MIPTNKNKKFNDNIYSLNFIPLITTENWEWKFLKIYSLWSMMNPLFLEWKIDFRMIDKLASLNRSSNKGTFRASGLAEVEPMPSKSDSVRVTGHRDRFRLSPTTLRAPFSSFPRHCKIPWQLMQSQGVSTEFITFKLRIHLVCRNVGNMCVRQLHRKI